ncbi:DUF1641 domain-containing protein [Paenibacillus sp. TRM 82003]|nr:DUF1641 domain-containing protein [Paenibacillus sp. TRM 82003]
MTMTNTQVQESAATTAASKQLEVLEQLSKPEIQQALTVLIDHLPKLAEMATQLTKAYDFAQTALNDRVLVDDIKGGVEEFVKPVQEKAKHIATAAIEANERAQASTQQIGIFGLLGLLKDPQVQHALRFSQAFLDVTGERKKQ